MITEYELYSDERQLSPGNTHRLFLGGVVCTDRGRDRLLAKLDAVRRRYSLDREMKWGKVSKRYLEAYQDYLRVFFEDPYARYSVLCINRSGPEWNAFRPRPDRRTKNDDRLASAFHQFLLVTFGTLRDTKRWTVFHDEGFFSTDRVLKNVEFLFNRTYKQVFGPKTSRIIRLADSRDSKTAELIQLADLLLGAASCHVLGLTPQSEARSNLVAYFHENHERSSQTKSGRCRISVVDWVPPKEFDYEATRC